MAKQIINIGRTANDRSGDPLRSAFDKVNQNFNELYARSENTDSQTLSLDGNTLSISGGNSVDLSQYATGGNANTGDVTFSGVKVIGAGTASGDGYGYSTLELVPDNNLYNNNQYIIVDPTAPNHIHLRAGGTQDASNAELYLGGERNNVRVNDYVGVRLNNGTFTTNFYNFQQDNDYDTATWSTDESGSHWIDITITDQFIPTRNADPFTIPLYNFSQYPQNKVEVFDGTNYIDLFSSGTAYTLGNQYQLRFGVTQAPATNPTTLLSLSFRIDTLTQSSLLLENNTFDLSVNQSAYVYADQAIQLTTGIGNLIITTDDNTTSRTWAFGTDGGLTFPDNTVQTTAFTGSNDTLDIVTGRGATTTNSLTVGGITSNSVTSGVGSPTGSTAISNGANSYGGANAQFDQNSFTSGTLSSISPGWTVSDGLGWTATITQVNAYNIPGMLVLDTDQAWTQVGPYYFYSSDYASATAAPLAINVGSNTWKFNTKGYIEFPQGVAPISSKGSAGDEIGSVAFDGTYIYYCFATYTDGQADIWRRIAWSNDTWGPGV